MEHALELYYNTDFWVCHLDCAVNSTEKLGSEASQECFLCVLNSSSGLRTLKMNCQMENNKNDNDN